MDRPFYAPGLVGLQADFYLLVLGAVYHADGLWGEATFDLYAREVPEGCGYLVAGGLVEAIEEVLRLGFSSEELEWLRDQETFARASEGWWDSLRNMRFGGDVHAVPEGSVVFPGEPLIRITAPLIQATLLETRLVQAMGHATSVATRAARLVRAADSRRLFDFGSRRLPGQQAALSAARAAIVGGFTGTTNTLAASVLDVPAMGTLSQGFMAAYGNGDAALEAFRVHFPDAGYLSLPEGDVVEEITRLAPHRKNIRIIRLEQRDLNGASRRLRGALDAWDMQKVRILASGDLDEQRITALSAKGAPVDLLAVGRRLYSDLGDPSMAYGLAELWRGPEQERVTHPGGARYPGVKQVLRFSDHDLICLADEEERWIEAGGQPMLEQVVSEGRRIRPEEPVQVAQRRCAEQLSQLPDGLLKWEPDRSWPLRVSEALAECSLG